MRKRLARAAALAILTPILVTAAAGSALACGGLVTPNGTVSLLKTTTLAAYHEGVEHYVTSFEFAGEGQEVGSIIPLPGVPTDVIKGGDWTLQRLIQETQPQLERAALFSADAAVAGSAEVIMTKKIAALDITVLKGGAVEVGNWAREHGYFLPPDAPEVLAFYAERSPIFLAARFNAERAENRGVQTGQGTPVHIVIPTPSPWVPLRILALGRKASEIVQADVYLLTDRRPETLPQAERSNGSDPNQRGLIQEVSEPASTTLLTGSPFGPGHEVAPRERHVAHLHPHQRDGREPEARPRDRRERLRPAEPGGRRLPRRRRAVAGRVDGAGGARRGRDPDGRHGSRRASSGGSGLPSVKLRAAAAAVALVLLVGAAAASRGAAARATNGTVHMTIHYSKFEPADLAVEPGETVRFVIENTDPIDHEFILGDEQVQLVHEEGTEAHHAPRPGEVSVPAGETVVTTYTFPKISGSLIFGCHLPGHYDFGMRGTVTIG